MAQTATLAKLREWKAEPCKYVYDQFKATPEDWQADTLNAFADPTKPRISMQACAGPGKSTVLSWCSWNFMTCYAERGEHPKAATLSITGQNLKDNLWAENSKWQNRSEFLRTQFTWNNERIYQNDFPSTWFNSARSFSKSANPEEQGRSLSGLHGKYLLYAIDESGDISPNVLKSAEQGLSTSPIFGKIIQAGNPTSLEGMLYAAATVLRSMWHIVAITGDPDDPKRSKRVGVEWAREQIKQYGRSNPWVMAFILGQFPPGSINSLFSLDEVMEAMGRHLRDDAYNWSQKRLGIDVARFGDDRTVIFPRQGLASFKPVVMRGARNPEIAARVALAKKNWGSEVEIIDGTGGFGGGVVDALMQAGHTPYEVHFASKAADEMYANKRAEMWFNMRDWVRRGGALPNIAEMVKELTAPTYTFNNGRFQLEPKEQIKKRLGFSPDYADALALTFALADMPASNSLQAMLNKSKHVSDYDPFSSSHSNSDYDPFRD